MITKAALFQALCAPLAISQRGWRALAIAAAKADVSANPIPSGVVESKEEPGSSIAVVSVDGPLSKDDSFWQLFFGGTSYASIRRKIEAAVNDDSISAIVLNVNSPGGEVFGCSELAGDIYAARDYKPVYAYISGQGDSAAYWLASAADEVIINATAEAGSIGVRCALIDDSEFLASIGVKEYDIVADQSPLKVVDASKAADRARVKAQMTDFASVFIADVAKNRNVTVQKVLSDFGRGDVLVGQAAVDAGLADRVGTLDEVIAELSQSDNPQKEMIMKINERNAAAAAAAPAASVGNSKCSSCKADMDDGDPMYCKACYGGASKAESFVKDVCALVGAQDAATAMGVLVAMKSKAETLVASAQELESVKAELAALKTATAKSEISTLIDAAVADGRMAPARRPEFEALADKYGIEALKAALSLATPAPAPAAVPSTDAAAADAAKKNAKAAPAPAWTNPGAMNPQQIKMLKSLGMSPEQFAEAQKNYLAAMNGGAEVEEN